MQVGDRSLIPAVGGTCRDPRLQDEGASHFLKGTTGRNYSALELRRSLLLAWARAQVLSSGPLSKSECPEGSSAQGLHTVPPIHAQHGQLLATPASTCSQLPALTGFLS